VVLFRKRKRDIRSGSLQYINVTKKALVGSVRPSGTPDGGPALGAGFQPGVVDERLYRSSSCRPELVFPLDDGPAGIYIHVPFCRSRCTYCAFVTNLYSRDLEESYLRSLRREIELWSRGHCDGMLNPKVAADTIYFGGGTPSTLNPVHVARLLDCCRSGFHIDGSAEITLEINPATVSRVGLADLRQAGVNRVSLGVQSLDDNELAAMGRRHTAEEALLTFAELRSAGFTNISVDLIAGFPGQSRQSVAATIRTVVRLAPEHVSVYLLEIKEGTRLDALIRRGSVLPPDDDLAADLYDDVRKQLTKAGYVHYEISNFARAGCFSKHNLKYWQDAVFVGLGPGAHGMTGRHRYANVYDFGAYVNRLDRGLLPFGSVTPLTPWGRFKDSLIMGARLVEGLDLKRLGQRYGIDAVEYVESTAGDLREAGLFVLEGGMLTLTDRGRLISNTLFARWV